MSYALCAVETVFHIVSYMGRAHDLQVAAENCCMETAVSEQLRRHLL